MTARPRTAVATVAAVVAAAVGAAAVLASADELFVHPRGFFVAPNATITVPVVSGTFGASAQAIERARLRDLSLRGPDGRTPIDRAAWTERAPRSTVRVRVGGPGTYVVGAEIAPRTAARDGAAFDRDLADRGITPILERRRISGRLGRPARESYTAAAKALIAVTDAAGHVVPPPRDARSAALVASGYAAEIVPLVDPYTLAVGGTVPVRALVGGAPLAGWTLRAGGTIGTSTARIPVQVLTTGRDGRADVRLTHDGHWFVAFVHMVDAERGSAVDYVSRQATLTFGELPQ